MRSGLAIAPALGQGGVDDVLGLPLAFGFRDRHYRSSKATRVDCRLNASKDGRRPNCRECTRAADKEYLANNEQIRKRRMDIYNAWIEANPERHKAYHREYYAKKVRAEGKEYTPRPNARKGAMNPVEGIQYRYPEYESDPWEDEWVDLDESEIFGEDETVQFRVKPGYELGRVVEPELIEAYTESDIAYVSKHYGWSALAHT